MTLNLDDIETFSIPMPSDEEVAKKIGLILDIAMDKAELAEHELRTAQDLKRAAMRALFTRGLRGEAQKETEIGPRTGEFEMSSNLGRFANGSSTVHPFVAALRNRLTQFSVSRILSRAA